jgi:hypothetical protein
MTSPDKGIVVENKVERWKNELLQYNFVMEYIKGEANEVADKLSRLVEDKSRTTTNEETSDSMETVQLGAMRLGREQLVSTVDTNSSATLYSQKLQSKPRKQVQFNDELTYIPPMNFIIVDE